MKCVQMEITQRMMEKEMISKYCLFAFEGVVLLPISLGCSHSEAVKGEKLYIYQFLLLGRSVHKPVHNSQIGIC